MYYTHFQLNNSRVLTGYQLTIQNKCLKCPPLESMHGQTFPMMDCYTLSKVLRSFKWFNRLKKFVGLFMFDLS